MFETLIAGKVATEITAIASKINYKDIAIGIIQVAPIIKEQAKNIYEKFCNYCNQYSEDQIKTLSVIREAYREHCYALEKDYDGITTLKCHNDFPDMEDKTYPMFFQVGESGRPLIVEKGFFLKSDQNYWRNHLKGELRYELNKLIGRICAYLTTRTIKIDQHYYEQQWAKMTFGGILYDYDPITLFFEEIKFFLYYLSQYSMKEELIPLVKARLKYFDAIYETLHTCKIMNDSPFHQELTPENLITKIRFNLKTKIIPLIKHIISTESTRDDLRKIKSEIEDCLENGMAFMFFSFVESEKIPKSFMLDEIYNPTLSNYKRILNSEAGQALRHLVNTDTMKYIFEGGFRNSTKSYSSIKWDNRKIFGQSLLPSGIMDYFFKDKNITYKFTELHNCIYRLSQFYLICNSLYKIAGETGDTLIYGKAACMINNAMNECVVLLEHIKKTSKLIFEKTKAYQENITKRKIAKHEVSKEEDSWIRNFSNYAKIYTRFKDKNKYIRVLIRKSQKNLKDFDVYEHMTKVFEEIEKLEKLIQEFTGKKQNSFNTDNTLGFNVPELLEKVSLKIKIHLHRNERDEAIKIITMLEEKFPEVSDVHLFKSLFYAKLNNYDIAVKSADKAFDLESDKFKSSKIRHALLLKAESLEKQGKKEESKKALDQCIEFLSIIDIKDSLFDDRMRNFIHSKNISEINEHNEEISNHQTISTSFFSGMQRN